MNVRWNLLFVILSLTLGCATQVSNNDNQFKSTPRDIHEHMEEIKSLTLDINKGTLNELKIGSTVKEVKELLGKPLPEEYEYSKKTLDYTHLGLHFVYDEETKKINHIGVHIRPYRIEEGMTQEDIERGSIIFKGKIIPDYITSELTAIEIRKMYGKPDHLTGDDYIVDITYYKDDFNLTFGFDYVEETDTILPLRDIFLTPREELKPYKYSRYMPELE
jgi:hypothetical protein